MEHVVYDTLTLEQFLRLPEAKPALEYIDGRVVQKVAAKRAHSVLHSLLGAHLLDFTRRRRLGLAYVELRCTYEGRSLVHDLCFISRGRIPVDERGKKVDDLFLAPELAIEILSPGQTVKNLSARLSWSVRHGVSLAWLLQPRKECVYLFRPGADVETLGRGQALDGGAILPDYHLDIDELFDWLELE